MGIQIRCRLWGAEQKQIVLEGQYVSCETHSPVARDELRLKAPPDSMQMRVDVASEEIIDPAAFLQMINIWCLLIQLAVANNYGKI
jgi:hypothetical protein